MVLSNDKKHSLPEHQTLCLMNCRAVILSWPTCQPFTMSGADRCRARNAPKPGAASKLLPSPPQNN